MQAVGTRLQGLGPGVARVRAAFGSATAASAEDLRREIDEMRAASDAAYLAKKAAIAATPHLTLKEQYEVGPDSPAKAEIRKLAASLPTGYGWEKNNAHIIFKMLECDEEATLRHYRSLCRIPDPDTGVAATPAAAAAPETPPASGHAVWEVSIADDESEDEADHGDHSAAQSPRAQVEPAQLLGVFEDAVARLKFSTNMSMLI